MIEVNNLIKKFGDFRALDGVNMHVASGNIYGLVGPNGAGKSTLIRHLTGVYRQDAGEIFIDGAPVYENKQVKAQMAYIPDEPFYFLQADTLEMMRYFRGMYESFDEKMFYRLQEFFPGIDMKRNIRRLSRGMQKQVAFWLALCCRPKLLILDEPLDGLDPVMRKQIWTILMSEVAERRTTVLVSSHNLRELEDVCDHVGIMNHGKVIIERSLFDLHGNISKIQVACQTGMPKLPKEFEVLHMSNSGRVYTMIVKGNPREVAAAIQTEGDHLAIVDILPLTLEEIFIYEMGGLGYEVKDILFNRTVFKKKCDPVLADLGMLSVIWDGKSAGAAVVASAATDGHDCLCQGLCIVQQSASGSGCGRNCNYGSRLWDGFVWLSVYPEECVYDPCTAGYKGGTVCDEYDQWPLFSIDSAGTGFSGNGGSLSFERHCECAVSGIVVFKCYGNCFFPLCNGVFLCHVYRTAVCTSGVLSGS